MASLENRGARLRLVFRLNGQRHQQAIEPRDAKEAQQIKATAERLIDLLEAGEKELPPGADIGLFVATGGKVNKQPVADQTLPLGKLFDLYKEATPEGHLEDSTLLTMRVHAGHAARLLGVNKQLGSITFDDLQGYVNRRVKEKNGRGDRISPITVRKELVTLSAFWNWAASQGKVQGSFPSKKLKYPATTETPRFQTWQEIERQVAGGGNDKLWDCLFLSTTEIGELLGFAETAAVQPYVYPMLVVACHTGARRSELIRSQVEDFDFSAGVLTIRERKRQRGHHGTRSVPLSPLLTAVLKKWIGNRTSGPTFFVRPGVPITKDEAHAHLQQTLAQSKWSKIKGWHTLRHSFASNCAARGLDQRIIDAWMGHQSEAMQKRYRHNFPDQHQAALASVFG